MSKPKHKYLTMRNAIAFVLGAGLLGVLAFLMSGCAGTNAVGAGETVEQKAYAAYGTVTIFAERGAALINDPSLSASIKTPVAQAIVAAKAPAEKTMEALNAAADIKAAVAAGETADEKLLVVANNLDDYYLQLQPLAAELVKAVTLGYKCRKVVGPELAACLGGGS